MIHLDTNLLIGAAKRGSAASELVRAWLVTGQALAVSAIAWAEFLNGPVTAPQIRSAQDLISGRIIPFHVIEATKSAELFNLGGRKRGSQPDCFIAATAICARASLATVNKDDFRAFVPAGLRLA